MSETLYITRTEFNQLNKKISFLEEFIKAQLQVNKTAKWVPASVAMEMLGVKDRKFLQMRKECVIVWKTSGKGRNIMVSRDSIEKYNNLNSNQI
jgi:hypothetical protein